MEALIAQFAFFTNIPVWVGITSFLVILLLFGYSGAPLWLWAVAGFFALVGVNAPIWLIATFLAVAVIFNVKPIRRTLISAPLMKLLDAMNILPVISETEQTAIEAGTVWVEGELFSGKPDMKKMSSEPYPDLTDKEREYLDGPVEELCRMVDDWKVFQRKDFDERTWQFMRDQKFFGLIIPEKYGGLNFSANAHSAIIGKLASRCGPLATTVM